MAVTDCLGRTPFGSIIATVICCVGVGLFCGTLYRAIDLTLRGIFETLFEFTVPWLETVEIVFIIIAVVMGLYAIMLLAFGFLATGATRQNLYSGVKCIMGGRMSAAFFMGLTWFLNFAWMFVCAACAMPLIIYTMLISVCEEEIEGRDRWYYENYCLNLSRFGIYRNYTEGVDKNALCDETDLSAFCQYVRDAGPMYGLAFAGSLLIVLGLANFLIVLAGNYQKIVVSKDMTEYRDAVDLELRESSTIMENMGKRWQS